MKILVTFQKWLLLIFLVQAIYFSLKLFEVREPGLEEQTLTLWRGRSYLKDPIFLLESRDIGRNVRVNSRHQFLYM